jgi:hypothetical protein
MSGHVLVVDDAGSLTRRLLLAGAASGGDVVRALPPRFEDVDPELGALKHDQSLKQVFVA